MRFLKRFAHRANKSGRTRFRTGFDPSRVTTVIFKHFMALSFEHLGAFTRDFLALSDRLGYAFLGLECNGSQLNGLLTITTNTNWNVGEGNPPVLDTLDVGETDNVIGDTDDTWSPSNRVVSFDKFPPELVGNPFSLGISALDRGWSYIQSRVPITESLCNEWEFFQVNWSHLLADKMAWGKLVAECKG